MRAQQRQPDHLAGDRLDEIVYQQDIAERLRHLFVIDGQESVVDPVTCKIFAVMGTAALRELVLVVRKDEVLAARMDVDRGAEVLLRHRRALDVPARPPASPRRIPTGQFRGRRFPQDEVVRISLVVGDFYARARDHLAQASLRQRPVVVVTRNVEQHVAIGFVGEALLDQGFDHRDHLGNMLGGTRFDIGRKHAQCGHVLVVDSHEPLGDFADRLAGFNGCRVDLVVDIGKVARKFQFIAAPQHARQQIEDHGRPRIADVGVVVDGGAAQIHRHLVVIERFEGSFLAQSGIVQFDRHSSSVCREESWLAWVQRRQ